VRQLYSLLSAPSMLKPNDLVVRADARGGQLERVMRVESVTPGRDDERRECVARAVLFDRVTPLPPAPVNVYRLATTAEIQYSERLGLLPGEIEGPAR
jgi:hypothetical protein